MGLNKFNQWGSGNLAGSLPIYRAKPLTLPAMVNGYTSQGLPVIRSGITDKYFKGSTDDGITLYTISSVGVSTSVAAITFSTYLSTGESVAYHLNSADACLYVLLRNGGTFQLIKINDTTGAVTAIGSSFIPVTPINWPINGQFGHMEVDTGSGHLKVWGTGFTHLINKTTGAIVSQDTLMVVGAFYPIDVRYVTQDGTVGVTRTYPTTTGTTHTSLPTLIHATYGFLPTPKYIQGWDFVANSAGSTNIILSNMTLIDSDKVHWGEGLHASSWTDSDKLLLRSEFDKYLKSYADIAAGVI